MVKASMAPFLLPQPCATHYYWPPPPPPPFGKSWIHPNNFHVRYSPHVTGAETACWTWGVARLDFIFCSHNLYKLCSHHKKLHGLHKILARGTTVKILTFSERHAEGLTWTIIQKTSIFLVCTDTGALQRRYNMRHEILTQRTFFAIMCNTKRVR